MEIRQEQLTTRNESENGTFQDEVVLLVGHGTRDPEGAAEFQYFVDQFQKAVGRRPVSSCFLELAEPPILPEIDRCAAGGAKSILALPFFLLGAGHVKNDVPSAINLARLKYPAVRFSYGAPLGVQPALLEILLERLDQADRENPSAVPPSETAVLLVERGSSDPDANSEVYKLARMLWESRRYRMIETAFIGITAPLLPEGFDRCAALGAKRIIVLPYFLFTGVLVKRIETLAAQKRIEYREIEIATAHHIGWHPRLIDMALNQLEAVEGNQVKMSCDLCKYRVRLPGYEEAVGTPQLSDHSHGLRGEHSHHNGHSHSDGHSEHAEHTHHNLDSQDRRPQADHHNSSQPALHSHPTYGFANPGADVGKQSGAEQPDSSYPNREQNQ